MKHNFYISIILLLATTVVLAACSSETESPSEAVEKTIYVAPELVDCVGVAPQKCLQVKENPGDPYTLFYDSIAGFDYEAGYEYEIRISEEIIDNPPADGSSTQYALVKVVNKTPAADPYPGVDETVANDPVTAGELMTLFVGPEIVDCEGVTPQKCLLVTTAPEDGYTLLYEQIAGFVYEPGYEYEIQVLVEPLENPPADGASVRYTLIDVLGKNPIEIDESLLEETNWQLQTYQSLDGSLLNVLPDSRITAAFLEGKIVGTSGCNNYFGNYELDGPTFQFKKLKNSQMVCQPETLMNQEAAFMSALEKVAGLSIAEDSVQFNDAAGQAILQFSIEKETPLMVTTW